MEPHSYTRSKQVDFHLSFILCTFLTHSQVDADIEVAEGNEKEQDSKEAETEVSNYKGALSYSDILPITVSFSFQQKHLSKNAEKL